MKQTDTAIFNFGELSLTVRNPRGVFIMSPELKQRIAQMPVEAAKKANADAWKQRKQYERVMNRCHNATLYPGVYDSVAGPHTVTECVCRETYKRMMVNENARSKATGSN